MTIMRSFCNICVYNFNHDDEIPSLLLLILTSKVLPYACCCWDTFPGDGLKGCIRDEGQKMSNFLQVLDGGDHCSAYKSTHQWTLFIVGWWLWWTRICAILIAMSDSSENTGTWLWSWRVVSFTDSLNSSINCAARSQLNHHFEHECCCTYRHSWLL